MPFGKLKLMVSLINNIIYSHYYNKHNYAHKFMHSLSINIYSTGLYGTLFRRNKEAAFSNYRLWESVGFVIAYAYSTHLCARMKLYVMVSVLIIGSICYIVVEILHRRKQKRLKAIAEDPKAAQAEANKPEETDDEKDDIDDDIIITHL